ncbi:MAG: ParA family protein [Deltaproteobacteria bacterium]|nr:ParA family protein [Deltaproteobacteria bacterium]
MKTIAFFNNKGGVGKTTLVYHVAWTLSDMGLNVLVADLDPQANLSSMFLPEERLDELWPNGPHPDSMLGAVAPILRGMGDIARPHVEEIADGFGLLVGDLGLSRFEDKLSQEWPRCSDGQEDAFRAITSFHRILGQAAEARSADVVLIDVGPNLGAINRVALLAAQHVVVPLAPDLFSLQGLRNLGPTLRDWRGQWSRRKDLAPPGLSIPGGDMTPAGYVVLQHNVRLDRPVKAYAAWAQRIPEEYRTSVLGKPIEASVSTEDDTHCLALLKQYRSLMPMAMEARKPIFHLRPADGARGAHVAAARRCGEDFERLTRAIASRVDLDLQAQGPSMNPHATETTR